jgi:hypothetical protein
VFVEITEKGRLPGFRLFRLWGIGAWQRPKKASREKTLLRRIKTWGGFAFQESGETAFRECVPVAKADTGNSVRKPSSRTPAYDGGTH